MGSFGITVNLNPMTGDLLLRGENTETRPGSCYCPTRCDPTDCSTPGFPVHHHLPEFAQTHVHWVSDAIQPSHPLSSPSIFPSIRVFSDESALCIRWPNIGASASASVLPMNIQDWSPLEMTSLISLLAKGLSRVFSSFTVQKHQFFSSQSSLRSNSYPDMTTGKTLALTRWTFVGKVMSLLLICCLGWS